MYQLRILIETVRNTPGTSLARRRILSLVLAGLQGEGSSLSAIIVVSSAYLILLVFLLAILIPACDSSSLAFHMMYSAYKLNKQGGNIQP